MDKKDYEEPVCPMDNSMWVKKKVKPIPINRVLDKADYYFAKKDYLGAERHFKYWWLEAEQGNDERGKLLICNELMGLYRKIGRVDDAKEYIGKAFELVRKIGLENTISHATALLNSGTVYKVANEQIKSLECFEQAKTIYDKELKDDDNRKAGLYNNMALTLVDLGRFEEAKELYNKALLMVHNINKPDEAITYLNLADCVVAEKGIENAEEIIQDYLDKAEMLLDEEAKHEVDSYYAYVCEKCGPVFDHYGYFFAADKCKERAEAIYKAIQEDKR